LGHVFVEHIQPFRVQFYFALFVTQPGIGVADKEHGLCRVCAVNVVGHHGHGFAFFDASLEQQGEQQMGAGVCFFAHIAAAHGLGDGFSAGQFLFGGQGGQGAFDAALDNGR